MNRRDILKRGTLLPVIGLLPSLAHASRNYDHFDPNAKYSALYSLTDKAAELYEHLYEAMIPVIKQAADRANYLIPKRYGLRFIYLPFEMPSKSDPLGQLAYFGWSYDPNDPAAKRVDVRKRSPELIEMINLFYNYRDSL